MKELTGKERLIAYLNKCITRQEEFLKSKPEMSENDKQFVKGQISAITEMRDVTEEGKLDEILIKGE